MISLYLDNGYVDVAQIRATSPAFTMCTGARGIGKTYSWLKSYRITQPEPFVYMRRTQEQLDMCMQEQFNPFRKLDADYGIHTIPKKFGKRFIGFYNGVESGTEIQPEGEPVCYGMALSTIHNIRGFDASHIKTIIYDEFIPEPHERWMRNEFEALMNAYETINRNRELQGEPPVQLYCLSNSNTLANPYFIGLRMVRDVDNMIKAGIELKDFPSKRLRIIHLQRSPISEQKAQTALYQLTKGTRYSEMAIQNKYANESRSRSGSLPLRELMPLVQIGELVLYRHKSSRQLYGSTHVSGSPAVYGTSDADIARWRSAYGWTWELYMEDKIIWQDYLPEILYRNFMGETY